MSTMPPESVLRWVADVVGASAKVVAVEGLHEGSSPWLLRIDHDGGTSSVVLRVPDMGRVWPQAVATGAAALRVAGAHGLAAPRLIASDLDGQAAGAVATLETAVPGSSLVPAKVSAERLRESGAAIAKAHAVPLEPQHDLPLRVRPTQADDRARERRWAALYRASTDSEKSVVVETLCERTGWSADSVRYHLAATRLSLLLHLADERLRAIPRPHSETVFVHGDIWAGNMMWSNDTCVALIDWKGAGSGDPGVDLGQLRLHMALQYGSDAPAQVLDGWQRESGRQAANLAYWDTVAALQTPAHADGWVQAFDDQGNPVSGTTLTERRDAFLREALDRLDHDYGRTVS